TVSSSAHSAKHWNGFRSGWVRRMSGHRHEDFTRDGQRYDLILAANAYRPLSDYRRVLKPDGAYVMTGGGGVQILQARLLGALVSVTSSRSMGNITAVSRRKEPPAFR